MRILYVATDQTVPGTKGGSTHVLQVAQGLASLGHEVHTLVTPGNAPFPSGPVHWHPVAPPFGLRQLRFLKAAHVESIARSTRAEIVLERYYNFGGEGVRAAQRLGVPVALEVNAPVIDYPGSPKQAIDRALLVQPMRRWRDRQCAAACLVVTPSASILSGVVPRERVLELEWGADVTRFGPHAQGVVRFEKKPGQTTAIFAGAFRRWHGAIHLVEAIRRLRAKGRTDISAVLIGDGPELAPVRQAAAGLSDVTFTGAIPYEQMPACLAAADIGIAPFDVSAHAPLAIDFYWSPLKVFEYMASALPVVAPDIPRLRRILTDGSDAVLYDARDPDGLAAAIESLAGPASAGHRAAMGAAGRERVVRDFGWDIHCRKLETALRQCVS